MTRVMRYELPEVEAPRNFDEPTACLGGWCAMRETCQHYHASYPARETPIERLCRSSKLPMYWPIFRQTAGTFEPMARAA
jgi:hypothetical protein